MCLVGKPVILVPSPNVAEDHQTKNAMALAEKDAAIVISDGTAETTLVKEAIKLVSDIQKKKILSDNIAKMAERDADIELPGKCLS